jgi:putative transposase
MNNENLSKKRQRKITNKMYDKIKNKVTDMQWKTINYLTKNYKNILIGNMSTKSIGESDAIAKITKRIGNMLRMFELKEKMKYKCKMTNTNYKEIEEAYTSKTCSCCGNKKDDLGGNKVYNCVNCGVTIGRDVNGAKNIFMLGIK